MRRIFSLFSGGLAAWLLLVSPALAGSRDPVEFPLRVHIFRAGEHSHYRHRMLEWVDGEGYGNLFAAGEPRGFEFSFFCYERFPASVGYETYMARWRKPNRDLEILFPAMGRPGAMHSCDLQVSMKDSVYIRRGGQLDEEPAAALKQWMERHGYDPEHGKNTPDPTPETK
jgi:hypothetical protein